MKVEKKSVKKARRCQQVSKCRQILMRKRGAVANKSAGHDPAGAMN
jgi:hypothetical protein